MKLINNSFKNKNKTIKEGGFNPVEMKIGKRKNCTMQEEFDDNEILGSVWCRTY